MPSARDYTVATRVTPSGQNWIDNRAKAHKVRTADVLRAALKVAAAHPAELDEILSTVEEF